MITDPGKGAKSSNRETGIGGQIHGLEDSDWRDFSKSCFIGESETGDIVEVGKGTNGNGRSTGRCACEILNAVTNSDVLDGHVGRWCQEGGCAFEGSAASIIESQVRTNRRHWRVFPGC